MSKFSSLLIDQRHLAMAYGYWKTGKADQDAVFQLSFRANPFKGNYAIACGLGGLIYYFANFVFSEEELLYIANLKDDCGNVIFSSQFINYLQKLKFTCDINAMPEGTLIFAKEPMLLIKGPLIQCLLLEIAIINMMSFATLVATKASRMYLAANCGKVTECGLRCAQGLDGGMIASRSAYIGGCEMTSNLHAGKELAIPLKTSMSHSWVMSFSSELEAFRVFADIMQDQTILLLDTYNVMQGLQNAIIVGTELRRRKHELLAVQLSCGNITKFAAKIRRLLNKAGFRNAKIFASGDVDENVIKKFRAQKLPIDAWDVSEKLVTAHEQYSLDMIYKLIAILDIDANWQYKVANPGSMEKINIPGIQQVTRFYRKQKLSHDIIYDNEQGLSAIKNMHKYEYKDMLIPIFRNGELIYQEPSLPSIRAYAIEEALQLVKAKISNYKVYLDEKIIALQKNNLVS